MKVVIDISKEDYDKVLLYSTPVGLLSNTDGIGIKEALLAIIDGKVLPKGHGNLIDQNRLLGVIKGMTDSRTLLEIKGSPIILEADKG